MDYFSGCIQKHREERDSTGKGVEVERLSPELSETGLEGEQPQTPA